MSRLLLIILLVALAYGVVKAWMALSFISKARSRAKQKSVEGRTMVQDPSCGVYIPKDQAIEGQVGDETHFFCSTECLEKYRSTEHAIEGP